MPTPMTQSVSGSVVQCVISFNLTLSAILHMQSWQMARGLLDKGAAVGAVIGGVVGIGLAAIVKPSMVRGKVQVSYSYT